MVIYSILNTNTIPTKTQITHYPYVDMLMHCMYKDSRSPYKSLNRSGLDVGLWLCTVTVRKECVCVCAFSHLADVCAWHGFGLFTVFHTSLITMLVRTCLAPYFRQFPPLAGVLPTERVDRYVKPTSSSNYNNFPGMTHTFPNKTNI